jgi:iron complex outermembrane receptor protein
MGKIAAGLACCLIVLSAAAQERSLESVVVTAQRRAQDLQEVPISITAFDAAELERASVTEAKEYLRLTPNVSFTEDGQTGSRSIGISIRGVSSAVTGENAFINSVGMYFNEFSVASVPNQVLNPLLPDMERIEVLRGPQGTYFGRNAVAGARLRGDDSRWRGVERRRVQFARPNRITA